ncbi:integral peroxisomal membrane peroxin, putative [Talaromyces stipitatus ATCC 10500]|uniref:Integral peroxisomal membrane peroxin, putative n=1 Tax=Talaromyces stipitatus (strain ATCC 10500 / CBS 375.48 / QM 6759 / NRRL 1006) TaxID=441959 RepID=B8M5C1_TALSN|nr:integral peroxisomal membrane peroxin, putative [Talaromyces stipitatus ATCC 10500]EED19727.1 integral peroxisomal membrane peroxin, putative [Talaromyces stipitatus ATCC 10500]
MTDYTADADAVANRDEPIPVVSFNSQTSTQSRLDKAKSRIPGFRHSNHGSEGDAPSGWSIQDRLFSKLLEQVVPSEEREGENADDTYRHPSKVLSRPPFSLPLMTNNFRRFNARIGIAFVFQARMIRLFSWRYPTQTWSFLAVYSFICLNPYLLIVLLPASVLLYIMVPAFLARHPPPPSNSTLGTHPYYSYGGPALAPAKTIKPASETSKDFFRNMGDLQNSMADFSNLHDTLVASISPLTNFSDETLSTTVFLLLTVVTASLFLVAHILPWRLIFFVGGNVAVISSHPTVHGFLNQVQGYKGGHAPEQKNQKPTAKKENATKQESPITQVISPLASISLDSAPEEREVEIFELQHRSVSPFSTSSEWETLLFSPVPYDPLSPSRIAGDRPRGCRFFEDVQAPSGWTWKGKKWELDLECREWVVERMITGVGFEVPGNGASGNGGEEQIGGWVWDLPQVETEGSMSNDEVSMMAYGDLPDTTSTKASSVSSKGKADGQGDQSRDWDGTMQAQAGAWRRRRWVRVVHRVGVSGSES